MVEGMRVKKALALSGAFYLGVTVALLLPYNSPLYPVLWAGGAFISRLLGIQYQ